MNRTSIIFSVPFFFKKTKNTVCLKLQSFFTVIVQFVWIKPWITWLLISNFPLFNYSSHQVCFLKKFVACPVKCWKYHGVFPRWRASLPSMLGNLTDAVLRCRGCKSHPLLQQIPSYALRKDLHPAAYTAMPSQGYRCDSSGFPKADPRRAPSRSRWEVPHGCPGRWLQSQPNTDFPWPCPWPLQEAPWALHCARGSRGWAMAQDHLFISF